MRCSKSYQREPDWKSLNSSTWWPSRPLLLRSYPLSSWLFSPSSSPLSPSPLLCVFWFYFLSLFPLLRLRPSPITASPSLDFFEVLEPSSFPFSASIASHSLDSHSPCFIYPAPVLPYFRCRPLCFSSSVARSLSLPYAPSLSSFSASFSPSFSLSFIWSRR